MDERSAYLAAACDGNEALRQEVESLLSSDDRGKSFLERQQSCGATTPE
jgi:hypothetical protein